jgi:hypothetical protein
VVSPITEVNSSLTRRQKFLNGIRNLWPFNKGKKQSKEAKSILQLLPPEYYPQKRVGDSSLDNNTNK